VSRPRTQTFLALIVVGVGLLLAAIVGLFVYMSTTATPLHPDPQAAPSVAHAAPSREWAGALERGRRVMRAALTGQNLPGLSVAVGIAGDIVWAEGFGWADLENRTPVSPRTRFRIGHNGEVLGGMTTSFVTFRKRGITVAVASNISYADTFSLAVKIAQAFAERD
jgi:serine beta-lactamase-like protein LACTB